MRLTMFLFFLIFLAKTTFGQDAAIPRYLQLGEEVPSFPVSFLTSSGTDEIPFEAFKGKVVVLEFWATFCKPCIPAMEHLEKIQSEVGGDLVVMAITEEGRAKVVNHLKKRPTSLQVVLDQTGKFNDLFYHQFMPHTVLIGPDGKVKAITTPEEVDAAVIYRLFSGAEVVLNTKAEFASAQGMMMNRPALESLYEMRVSLPTAGIQTQVNYVNDFETQFVNCSVPYIYSILNHTNVDKKYDCVEVNPNSSHLLKPEEMVNFSLKVPEHLANKAEDIGLNYLEAIFELKIKVEKRGRKVMRLELNSEKPLLTEGLTIGMVSEELQKKGLIPYRLYSDEIGLKFNPELPVSVNTVNSYFESQGFEIQSGTAQRNCLILEDGSNI